MTNTINKDQPFESTFTDKDTTRGTWTMTFKDWSDFHSYVGQKSHIIESYHLFQS